MVGRLLFWFFLAVAPIKAATMQEIERLEPGGWGACLSMSRHPISTNLWVGSFDVGGLAFSQDDGRTWSVGCNPSIATLQIFTSLFAGAAYDTLVLGTSRGIYVGKFDPHSASCPWKLRESNTGLQCVNKTQSMKTSHHEFTHPIRALSLAKNGTLWAGVGMFNTMGPEHLQQGDPMHVYRSDNLGSSWIGQLILPGGGGVETIAAGHDGKSAFVACATGIFATHDGGAHWMEAGVSPVTFTADAGHSWHECKDHAAPPCPFSSAKVCTGVACLPIAGSGPDWNETHPNARSVVVAPGGLVFATIFDVKSHPASHNKSCTFTQDDPTLQYFRGGPYVSADGGFSWRWLFRGADGVANYTAARLRCPGVPVSYSTTNFPAIAVDPAQPTDHMLLGGWGAAAQGLTALRDGQWRYWNDCGAPTAASNSGNLPINTSNLDRAGCYEGLRPNTFQSDANMYVFAMDAVSWNTTERRVITNGTVLSASGSAHNDTMRRPLVYLTGFRGAVRGAWDPVNHRFSFKQFGDTLVGSPHARPPTWRTTGFGDTCVSDVVWPDPKDPAHFVMAVADGGLAATLDRGLTWQRTSELWPGALGEATSLGTAVTAGSGCIFAAHNDRGGSGMASVLAQCDGADWKVIGGLHFNGSNGHAGGNTGNGMGGTKYVRSLHMLPPTPSVTLRPGTGFRLLAAAEQAFLIFDPTRPPGSQWRNVSIPETCGVGKAVVDLSASVAFAACGKAIYMLGLQSLQLTRVALNITGVDARGRPEAKSLRPHQKLTTLLVWPEITADAVARNSMGDASLTWKVVLGTQYPPVTFIGDLTASGVTATAMVTQSFDPKSLYNSSATAAAIELMTMTSIARLANGNIACGLFVGDYFDGDLPPDIYVSTDEGASWAAYGGEIANTNVRNMVLDPRGKLCMASDGCGLICVADQEV